jgi:Mg2+ and Co2+ transporter CorA
MTDNPHELQRMWEEMAALRDYLSALNLPGLRSDPDKAWLPVSQHNPIIEADERVDRTLDRLNRLSDTMRSGSVLHVQQLEEERERREEFQRRIEVLAAIFLVPTLIAGSYGTNIWVPGQGRHLGFWVMVLVMLIFSAAMILLLLHRHRAQKRANRLETKERERRHAELLRRASA